VQKIPLVMPSPALRKWLDTQPAIRTLFNDLTNMLRRRKIRGPDQCARETLVFLKHVLGKVRGNAQDMMDHVHAVGAALMEARPMELAVGNILRRVLFIIREEFASKLAEEAKEKDDDDDEDDDEDDDDDERDDDGPGGFSGDRASARSRGASTTSTFSMQPSLSGVLSLGGQLDYTTPVRNLMSNIMGQVLSRACVLVVMELHGERLGIV